MNRAIFLAGLVLVTSHGASVNAQVVAGPQPADQLGRALAALPHRSGSIPNTTPAIPHVQIDQNAPVAMQAALLDGVGALADVQLWATPYSLAGSIGWLLPASVRQGPVSAYSREGEFGHSHRPEDGSMHLRLPAAAGQMVVDKGWGILHPISDSITGDPEINYLMIFGPRDEVDLEAVWVIVQSSYATARGLDLGDTSSTAIEPATWGQAKEAGPR